MTTSLASSDGTRLADGRRQRSERNRQKIIAAMFELVRGGDFDPSVARIAETAGVGLRTVFRHFEDVDSLYQEMAAEMEARILPEIRKPLSATDWQGRIRELMARRIRIFEEILPVRTCASLRRFQSGFLMEAHQRFLEHERAGLIAALPQSVASKDALLAAFDVVLCFETWRRLRQDRKRSVDEAKAVVEEMLDALVAAA